MEVIFSTVLANSQVSYVKPSAGIDLPPTGAGIFIDPNDDIYQQVDSYFQQLGYEVPSPTVRTQVESNQLDQIIEQAKTLLRELKISGDKASRVLLGLNEEFALEPSGATMMRKKSSNILPPIEDGRKHIGAISGMIDNIHKGYQKEFGEIIKATTKYMQDVNTALGKIPEYIKAGDSGKIKLQRVALLNRLDDLFEPYTDHKTVRGNKPLITNSDAVNITYYENWSKPENSAEKIYEIKYSEPVFEFWKKKLDGQGFKVETRNSGNNKVIRIYPDLKPLREIMKSIYDIDSSSAGWASKGVNLLAQSVQSMQTAIDAQKNAVNNSVSRLLETFRQDNSHFDTLTQLLIQLIKDLNQYNSGLSSM
ncbi:IpaD/SipD/SspD family type III secretion system needle tip protein [Providencia rettgeri]|nr:IpaD/SipD/SspD family type III secretion system needle tip protein [Providencia rettgeri]ELQ1456926.1 IpaD/SipD/SspD family type III secretion system needle tip protein [Providencia rettgeri]ELR5186937.1 IpaD/SipD/SspD family type III secretion system needle tip protein [Providencia rettgeri]EMB0751844.1 IpaD/SipD/SspD family type III secretion system needle tip protein [Providencia rettgeri]